MCVYSVSFVCRSCVVNVTLIIICVLYGAMDKASHLHTHNLALFRPCAEQHARVRIVHSTQVCAVLICDLSHRMSKPTTMR